jgi:tetratricopeptide (TPR) repeat protein
MKRFTAVVTFGAFFGACLYSFSARAQGQPAPAPAAQPAAGDEALQQAKTHFEAGKNAYNAGDYPSAIREFKAAEALRPSPVLDYNIGLANEKLGKKRVAVKYYRRYLEGMPNAANRSTVEASIAQLEREIAAAPPPSPQQPQQGPAVEQPGDMPPAQPVAPQQPSYGSYDPYAQPAPYYPPPQPPPKKKSYWWVALIVVLGVALIVGIAVAVALTVTPSSSTTTFDHAVSVPARAPPQVQMNASQRTPGLGSVLFSF